MIAGWIARELPVPAELAPGLAPLLAKLIREERLFGGCIEERALDAPAWTISGIGVSSFICDRTAADYLARPYPYLGLTLLGRAARKPASVFLQPREIGRANAHGGLNLIALYYSQTIKDPADERCRRIMAYGSRIFIRIHAGYNLRLLLQEDATAHEDIYRSAGYQVLHRFPAGTVCQPGHPGLHEDRSLVGLDAAAARRAIPGAVCSFLFGCRRPELELTEAQRRLVGLALDGHTDIEIAASLARSPNTLKQTWRSIYERVERRAPSALGDPGDRLPEGRRGAEKRRRLLAYMQEHVEEIRPWSRGSAGARRV